MRRSLNQTVGRIRIAVKIPNKCTESKWRPPQSKDLPGNTLLRLSPSRMMNSTQYDCNHEKRSYAYGAEQQNTGVSKETKEIVATLTYNSVYKMTCKQ